jgi:hypothetical protein
MWKNYAQMQNYSWHIYKNNYYIGVN